MEGRVLPEKARFPSCFKPQEEPLLFPRRRHAGRTATGQQTSTHVFPFQDIDKFGNEITQLARPLPVEYLIIDVSVRLASPKSASLKNN